MLDIFTFHVKLVGLCLSAIAIFFHQLWLLFISFGVVFGNGSGMSFLASQTVGTKPYTFPCLLYVSDKTFSPQSTYLTRSTMYFGRNDMVQRCRETWFGSGCQWSARGRLAITLLPLCPSPRSSCRPRRFIPSHGRARLRLELASPHYHSPSISPSRVEPKEP